MPATNLNIGMDLWNASPASAEAAKMRHNQSNASAAVAISEQWIQVHFLPLFFFEITEHSMSSFSSQHLLCLLPLPGFSL